MTQELKLGQIIHHTYRLDQELGHGGMGKTYRAMNIALDQTVAIKVLNNSALGETGQKLFLREARLLRSLKCEGVVEYETAFMDENGHLYLVMEYLSGRPLSYFFAQGGRLQSHDVLTLGLRLARALRAIHAKGVIHRDVSPDNLIVVDDQIDKTTLIDFGVASNQNAQETTIIGQSFVGKFNYSSPEQLGLYGGKVTHKSDLYSLGLILMRALGLPVPGQDLGVGVVEHRREDILLPQSIAPEVKCALEALLKADANERPDEAETVFTSALGALSGTKVQPTSPSVVIEMTKSHLPRWPFVAALICVLGVMVYTLTRPSSGLDIYNAPTQPQLDAPKVRGPEERYSDEPAPIFLPEAPRPIPLPEPPSIGSRSEQVVDMLHPMFRPNNFSKTVRLVQLRQLAREPWNRHLLHLREQDISIRTFSQISVLPDLDFALPLIDANILYADRILSGGRAIESPRVIPTDKGDPLLGKGYRGLQEGQVWLTSRLARALKIENAYGSVDIRFSRGGSSRDAITFKASVMGIVPSEELDIFMFIKDVNKVVDYRRYSHISPLEWYEDKTRLGNYKSLRLFVKEPWHADKVVRELEALGISTEATYPYSGLLTALKPLGITSMEQFKREIDALEAELQR